ncbi:gas vesicle protein GvpQ [Oceanobacillus piezotolerans]|uniref:Gas vesicle protein GvpQ n=1 Tax=Oceanobacillus piezotolerans TaxID=2448030 RepID=A0A498D3D0_9BACI|nr:gas vesicle protein GvpQ [Oceanobacillus piezotolerans]RLL42682.1 gas vesicle protein GvpQ [Oceanobacillus piezotolerans]
MKTPQERKTNHTRTAALTAGATLFFVISAPLLVPKVRHGAKKIAPKVKDALKRADGPVEFEEEAKSELKKEMAEQFREQFVESIQSELKNVQRKLRKKKKENAEKVHNNAKKAEGIMQDTLLKVKDNVAGAKEAGESFQKQVKDRTAQNRKLKGADQIKGASRIKSSATVKSVANIKGHNNIKHQTDNDE